MPFSLGARFALIAPVLVWITNSPAQDDVEISAQPLSETVFVLFGTGGNIAVSAGPDGVFIVDDQWSQHGDPILAVIREFSDQPVRYVINTHWHFDHTDGNKFFGEKGSIIIAHDNVRQRMLAGGYIRAVDVDVPPAPLQALPIVTFSESLTLHLNGEDAQVIYVEPAHTDGDAVIFFKDSNIVHTGDIFLNGIFPLVDLDSGGSIDGIIGAMDMLLAMVNEETRIIPGHGPVARKTDILGYRDMCMVLRDRIVGMKTAGMTLEEVIAARPTAEFDEKWGAWGEGWRTISVTSLYEGAPDQ